MMKVIRTAMIVLMIVCVFAAALAESSEVENVITVQDQDGIGVEGVLLSVCVANYCTCVATDENGNALLPEDHEEIEIHIISVPEGYAFDAEAVYTLEDMAEPITVTKE